MRRLLAASFLLCLLAVSGSAAAQSDTATAPELYARAVKNLDTGFWFEQDISDLNSAVLADPKNAQYHLALGCAEVDRAGSLAYAASVRDAYYNDQAQYAKDFAAWQAAQEDPKNGDFGKPAPQPPPDGLHFQTKDDLTTLHLTGKEAAARAIALGQAAQDEWAKAVALSPAAKERSAAENVQGWGLRYERLLLYYTGYADRVVPGAPKRTSEAFAFANAIKDDPKNADAWEGLGGAYPYEQDEDRSHAADIIRAWQHAIALKPGNAGLLFQLYQVQTKADPDGAMETLRGLATADPDNSYVQYGFAELLFHKVHYNDVNDTPLPDSKQYPMAKTKEDIIRELASKDDITSEMTAGEAISYIEQGNAGSRFEVPEYAPPVPKMMQYAWDYWNHISHLFGSTFTYMAALRELARAVTGYGRVSAAAGNITQGVEAERACIGIGLHLAGDWPIHDANALDDSVIQTLVGIAVAAIGYKSTQQLYESVGNSVSAQGAEEEYSAFQQRAAAYKAAVIEAQKEETYHLYDGY